MEQNYKTQGTCSRSITFDVENNTVKRVSFEGGCQGNLRGVTSLIEGMNVDDVIAKLNGINCGNRGTSCPDQLAKALIASKSN